ncbi:MAG: hypothetical protein RLZZ611_2366 [Cyanobacteriota bacterium]|jgi:hypothetical protein
MANRDSGSGSLGTLLAGALLGAAGLTWWLLSETERRRRGRLELSRYSATEADSDAALEPGPARRPLRESDLQDKVHQLNQAIEDVRRQLESLSTPEQG